MKNGKQDKNEKRRYKMTVIRCKGECQGGIYGGKEKKVKEKGQGTNKETKIKTGMRKQEGERQR